MRAFVLLLVGLSSLPCLAQTVEGFDPHASVTVADGGILIGWNALTNSGNVVIRRQQVGSAASTTIATLDAGVTSFFEPLAVGQRALYRVQRTQQNGLFGESMLLAGVEAPFTDDPGLVLVLVDETNSTLVRAQLDVLGADLRDDGFEVLEQAVPRAEPPPQVKARIAAALTMAAGRPLHVLILGAVPRAFSGIQNPDGHPDHLGAWPADPYYADLTGLTFTDTSRGGVGAFTNDAGDGKFDQSYTSPVECAVGRVDFERMPAFGADAGTVQLARYLDKVHRFRIGAAPLPRRALVRPTFGYFSGEAFGRAGYRDGTAILGQEPINAPFFPTLEDGGVLLAWGDGPGSPTTCGNVTTTAELAMRASQTRFMGLFGSYFGDWNYQDNLMRAALGSGETVTSLWFARPQVQLFALGGLESFGRAFSRDTNFMPRGMPVYQALLGDPTLRLFYPPRLTSLTAQPLPGYVRLQWAPYTGRGTLVGYHLYRLTTAAPLRLTSTPIAVTTFDDTSVMPLTSYRWRVVAVVRETTGSGTFLNHSLGARTNATTVMGTFDAGVVADAGNSDAGAADAGRVDAGAVDGGSFDAGLSDAGGFDAGLPTDAGFVDAGAEDAGLEQDSGTSELDAGSDAGLALTDAGRPVDAGVTDTDAGVTPLPIDQPTPACSCDAAPAFLVAPLFLLRRRRRPLRAANST